ncbi:MAG: TRAP transporter TatT component family protein [Bacteriovoracaceae bacterium]|nr:TRAP transporter TatT component family protein [Bacteriovoracaceae bacterium]
MKNYFYPQTYLFCVNYIFILLGGGLFGCSGLVKKMATNTTAELAKEGSQAPYYIFDYDYFSKALPGNLLFLESLRANSPKNSTLFVQIIKAYSSYGFGYGETEMMKSANSLGLSEISKFSHLATPWYAKAVKVGDEWLKSKGSSLEKFIQIGNDESDTKKYLNSLFKKDDAEGLFYFGQAWASYLNFHRDQPELVLLLPQAKSLIDFACEWNPNIDFGACDLFKAVYLLSRPKMLGGNPESGENNLQKLRDQYPQNLLYPISYIQYVLIPQDRVSEVKLLLPKLLSQFEIWQKQISAIPVKEKMLSYDERLNLFNAIAWERFQILNATFLKTSPNVSTNMNRKKK